MLPFVVLCLLTLDLVGGITSQSNNSRISTITLNLDLLCQCNDACWVSTLVIYYSTSRADQSTCLVNNAYITSSPLVYFAFFERL